MVIGEGLAAGQANFGLNSVVQSASFPAQMARQMGTMFPQPLIQGPHFGDVLGYPPLPTRFPTYPQTTVRILPRNDQGKENPTLFVFNLAVPNMKILESLSRRPAPPLIHEFDNQQNVINMILGFPALLFENNPPLWTQLEYAEAMNPTLALIELGYYDVLDAAVAGDPGRIPSPAAFRAAYSTIVSRLRARFAEVIVTTIPDPMDTAYFSSALTASRILQTPPFVVLLGYGLTVDDYITRDGLQAIGNQLFRRKIEPLPPGSTLSAATAAEIRGRVKALNAEIATVAREQGARVYDLHALFNRVRASGVTVGTRFLTADYLGGFYSLDGFYPGATGHAIIANEVLTLLNQAFRRSFAAIDVEAVMRTDAVAQYRQAEGVSFSFAASSAAELLEGVLK